MQTPTAETETHPETEAAPCGICAVAKDEGWYASLAQNESHCRRCHRTWSGHRQAHCVGCCRHFSTDKAFTGHQLGGACNNPEDLHNRKGERRYTEIDTKYGPAWKLIFRGKLPDFKKLENPAA